MEVVRNRKTNQVDIDWFRFRINQERDLIRFSLDEPKEEIEKLLFECLKNKVERRCLVFVEDEQMLKIIKTISSWLTNPEGKVGMVLSGKVGNGKTTMMEAIRTLINALKPSESYDKPRTLSTTATELNELAKDEKKTFIEKLKRVECLFIDDLGCEAQSVKVYGNTISPITDVLYQRYNQRGFTVITTNMQKNEIQQRYGERIADRFNELFSWITFTSPSYRK